MDALQRIGHAEDKEELGYFYPSEIIVVELGTGSISGGPPVTCLVLLPFQLRNRLIP